MYSSISVLSVYTDIGIYNQVYTDISMYTYILVLR